MASDDDGDRLDSGGGWSRAESGALGRETAGGVPPGTHPFATEQADRYAEGVVLGEGGMGRVSAAHDARLGRPVALKRLAEARRGEGARARLAQEAWITGHLEHPGIVPVYDAGIDASGELYYTMRLIRGRSLAADIAERPALADRLPLLRALRDACEAVGYAHAQGVVHCDLKPENIMLGSFGETQVVDWGVACVVGDAGQPAAGMVPDGHGVETVAGAVTGTPAYMAPEQARAAPPTPRSDVYGLGATLLELLSGRRPFHALAGSDVLERLRAGELLDPDAAAPDAPPALLAVARRALHPAPAQRYPDAKAMADEITAWMDGRRVEAHVYGLGELWRRFARAHRVPLAVGAVALALLLAVGVVAHVRTTAERDRARAAEASAVDEKTRADRHLARALLEKARVAAQVEARAEAEVLAAHALRLLGESAAARGLLARFAASPRPRRLRSAPRPPCPVAVLAPDGARLLCLGDDAVALYTLPDVALRWRIESPARFGAFVGDDAILLRHREAHTLHDAATGRPRRAVEGSLEWGSVLVGGPAALSVWTGAITAVNADGTTWRTPADPEAAFCEQGPVRLAAWRPDGSFVASCDTGPLVVASPDGRRRTVARLPTQGERDWVHAPRALPERPPEWATVSRLAVTPDGRVAVLGTWKGEVLTVDLETGAVGHAAIAAGGPVRDLDVSPDGRWAVVSTERGGPGIWDLRAGVWAGRLPADAGGAARFTGTDALVTVGPERISVWRLPEAPAPAVLHTRTGLASLAWSADGEHLAAGQAAGWVDVWRARDGARLARHRLGDLVIKAVAFSAERTTLVTYGGGEADFARLEAPDWTPVLADRPLVYGRHLGLLRGDWLLRADLRHATWARLDDAFGLRGTHRWGRDPPTEVMGLGVSPDRRLGVFAFQDGLLARVSTDSLPGDPAALGTLPGVTDVEIGDDGALLVQRGGHLSIYGPTPDAPRASFPVDPRPVDVAWSPEQRWIAAGLLDGAVRLYDARDGRLVAEAQGHRERAAVVAFAPDGRSLASGGWDKALRRWGLDALERAPEALLAEVGDAWGLTLEDALAARVD